MTEKTKNKENLSVDDIINDIRKQKSDLENSSVQSVFGSSKSGRKSRISDEPTSSIFDLFEKEDAVKKPKKTVAADVEVTDETVIPEAPQEETKQEKDSNKIENSIEDVSVDTEDVNISDDDATVEYGGIKQEKFFGKDDMGKTKVFRSEKTENGQKLSERTLVAAGSADEPDIDELEKRFNEEQKVKIREFRLNAEKLADSTVYDSETDKALSVLDAAGELNADDIFTAVEKVKKPKKENVKRNEIIKKRNSKVYDKIDVGRVRLELNKESSRNFVRIIALLAVFVIDVVAEILKTVYTGGKLQSLSTLMSGKNPGAYLIALALSVPVLAVAFDMFYTRLKNSEKFAFTAELSMLVISAANFVHCFILTVKHEPVTKNTLFFTAAVSFIALIQAVSDRREIAMITKNLDTITQNEKILGIFSLDRDTNRLASGISDSAEPTILCAGEVEVPNSFMDSSTIKDKQNAYMKIVIPCMLAFSAVCAAIAYITYNSVTALSTAFISTLLMCSPAILSYTLSMLLSNANSRLNRNGCEILGYEAVEYMDNVDAIVLDTADVFSGEISRFHIINSRSRVTVRHAFEIACSVILSSGGVLGSEAEKLLKEGELDRIEVEDIKYEERLGLSCWVAGKRTLLGTRRMMEEHNLAVPPAYTEEGYLKDGKKVLYLAIDSQVTAMFCAEYFIGRQTKKQLEKLYKTGVILMLMTTDPNIDEEFVANTLGIDASSIKIVSSSGTESIKQSLSETTKQKRTGLIFKRSVAGLLRVINTAFRLYDVQALTILIQTISIGFAFAVMAVLNLVATSYFATFWLIIVYHVLWAVLSHIMTSRAGND